MFPLLPILILLLLGPLKAERLAVEGRLPAGILAYHRARVAPVRATVVAPVEKVQRTAVRQNGILEAMFSEPLGRVAVQRVRAVLIVACPPRAGP